MKSRIFTIFQIFCAIFMARSNAEKTVSSVWTTVGDKVILPCPFSPSIPGDRTVLVLWFRDSSTESVYSFDARKDDFSSGVRWFDKDVFGQRAFFTLTSNPPSLVIDPVNRDDQGQYVCRVEYQRSPSTFIRLSLSVIIPPEPPVILWKGREVMGPVGPLKEGENVRLTCQTKGGRPTPLVTWWKEGGQLNSITEAKVVTGETVVQSTTTIVAERFTHKFPLLCHAQAPYPGRTLSLPRTVTATLDVILPPLSIKITGLDNPVVAGTTIQPVCLTSGSNPLAEIRWVKGGLEVKEASKSVLNGGNITSSTITLQVNNYDHGKVVQCIAYNSAMDERKREETTVSDSVKLEVLYPPKIKLHLGEVLNASNLIEGEDAFLECTVNANPPPHRIQWLHNGRAVDNSNGIVVSGASLAMQKLKKEHAGSYRCSAENLEGKSFSNFLEVKIKYSPVCASDKDRTQGVALGSATKILCRIEADPAENLTFSWSRILPNGREMQLPFEYAEFHDAHSYFSMTPRSLGDFGQYLCRAKNKIGVQKKPCKITIVSAGPPEVPNNCTVVPGSESLSVSCKEGFHGGFPQKFRLEAWLKDVLIENETKEFPSWTIERLEDGAEVKIKIRAVNTKGFSNVISLEAHMPIAHQQSVTIPERSESLVGPLLGAVLGVLTVLILLFVVAVLTIFRRRHSHRRKPPTDDDSADGLRLSGPGDVSPDVVSSIQCRSSPSADVLTGTPQDEVASSDQLIPRSSSRYSCEGGSKDQQLSYIKEINNCRNKTNPSPVLSRSSLSANSHADHLKYASSNAIYDSHRASNSQNFPTPHSSRKHLHHHQSKSSIPNNTTYAGPEQLSPNSRSISSITNFYRYEYGTTSPPPKGLPPKHRSPKTYFEERLQPEDRISSYENLDDEEQITVIQCLEKSPRIHSKYQCINGRSNQPYPSQPKNEIFLKIDITSRNSEEGARKKHGSPNNNSSLLRKFKNNKKKNKNAYENSSKTLETKYGADCVIGTDDRGVRKQLLEAVSQSSVYSRESTV